MQEEGGRLTRFLSQSWIRPGPLGLSLHRL